MTADRDAARRPGTEPGVQADSSVAYWPVTRSSGDVDKLLRAALDALTDAGVWRDDPEALCVPGVVLTVRRAVGPQ